MNELDDIKNLLLNIGFKRGYFSNEYSLMIHTTLYDFHFFMNHVSYYKGGAPSFKFDNIDNLKIFINKEFLFIIRQNKIKKLIHG